MIFALIPAAGKSTRMGRPKLALPLGDRSVLEHVIAALHEAGIEHILVVVGPHVPELATIARRASADVLLLEEETADMLATVKRGLAWIDHHHRPTEEDTLLLLPGDHPTLVPGVLKQLTQAAQQAPDRSIAVPTAAGKRGHPALIRWKHVANICSLPPESALNTYLRQYPNETLEVFVNTREILFDLDTPKDYEEMRKRLDSA